MITLVLVYVGAVVLKHVYEMIDHLEAERGVGIAVWWAAHRLGLAKKFLVHIPLCAAWVTGGALAAVNAMTATAGLGAMESVTAANTIMAAWMLDSFGKPFAKRLKKASDGD